MAKKENDENRKLLARDPGDELEEEIPLDVNVVSPESVEVQYGHMLGCEMAVDAPARAVLSALAAKRLGELSMKRALGTTRPSRVLLGNDDNKKFLYIVPASKDELDATEVKYPQGKPYFNLIHIFTLLDRSVQEGTKEYYKLKVTPRPVKIAGVTAYGLYTRLDKFEVEPTRPLTEEEKNQRKAKSEQRKRKAAAPKPEEPNAT